LLFCKKRADGKEDEAEKELEEQKEQGENIEKVKERKSVDPKDSSDVGEKRIFICILL